MFSAKLNAFENILFSYGTSTLRRLRLPQRALLQTIVCKIETNL